MSSSASTLNSYGYSPHPLRSYAEWVKTLLTVPTPTVPTPSKPVIISVTSPTPEELREMITIIRALRSELKALGVEPTLVAVELNTSCPNIEDTPPPSYHFPSLLPFLEVLADAYFADPSLTIGLKLPPYLYATCFHDAINAIASFSRSSASDPAATINPFAFITCTNTLGSCLLFPDQVKSTIDANAIFALPTPLGGLGGEAIHAIALGNVYHFSRLISQHSDSAIRSIKIFGAGGVASAAGAERMYKAGASVVECATLLGEKGVVGFSIF